MIAQRFRGFAI